MPEPTLAEIQQWMKSRILPEARPSEKPVCLDPQGGDPGEVRLAVYAEGYLARMEEALAEVYEAVHKVCGEAAFHELAVAYAKHFPSTDYNLSLAGRHLSEFLSSYPLREKLPFLKDLAALEWAVSEAFHAEFLPPPDPARLKNCSTEDFELIRLQFQPSLRRVASVWPILDIWQSRKTDRQKINIDLKDRPQNVLIVRKGYNTNCRLIDPKEDFLLEGLLQGKALGQTAEAFSERHEADTAFVSRCFGEWMREGLVTGFSLRKS